MTGIGDLLGDKPAEVFGDRYNFDTGQLDMNVRYHIDRNGEPVEAKYRAGGSDLARLEAKGLA